MDLLNCFYIFMTALFAALIAVPFLRKWALEQGALDIPDERKTHDIAMPSFGGIAIFLSFLFALIVFVPVTPLIRGVLAGGLIIFVTGMVDDLTDLTAKRKFLGEVAACLVTIVLGNLWLRDLGNPFGFGEIILPIWIGIPFTVFAVVGVINAMNLIDGLDGLAGGSSVMILAAFFLLGWLDGDQQTAMLAAALVGGILGFLKYNFYPARIFMGDAGSLTVGFVLGFLAVHTTQQPGSTISPMVPILVLSVPLLDTLWVMSRRMLNKQSPFIADRTHLHHKFLDLGFEHRFTVVIIYSLVLFWIVSALLLRSTPDYFLLLYLLVSASLFYLTLRYLLRHPDQFKFLQRDKPGSIRLSVRYQRVVKAVDRLTPFTYYLLVGYLLLALWSFLSHPVTAWQIAPVLLVVGVYLWFRPFADNRPFLMLILYAAVSLAVIESWHANQPIINQYGIRFASDALLALAGVIALLKFLFRKPTDFFLSTADFLTLMVCIFLAIAAQKNAFGFDMNASLARSVVGVIVIRALCSYSLTSYRMSAWSIFFYLTLVTVVGLGRTFIL